MLSTEFPTATPCTAENGSDCFLPIMKASKIKELEDFAANHKGWLFRGHRSSSWKLVTSLERASKRCGVSAVDYERQIWGEFRRHAHSYFPRVPADSCTIEWLALMQHYGAPTRLLDFTYSFWIALFFAYEEADEDCVVVALDPNCLAKNNTDTDYNVVLRANIDRKEHKVDDLYCNMPFYTNDRLAIQKGTFVFSLNLDRPFEDLIKQKKELIISKSLFTDIRSKLNEFNCNSRVLFPGIDGYSRYFKNHTA
jgi:hypothetical protein